MTTAAGRDARLAANREQMIAARLNVFENRYELASARLHAALEQGTIRETAEVAAWLIVRGTYGVLLDSDRHAASSWDP